MDDGSLVNVAAQEHQPPLPLVPTRDDADDPACALTPAVLPGEQPTATITAPDLTPTITPEDQLPQALLDAVAHKSAPPLRAGYAFRREDLKGAMLLAVREHGSLACAARAVGVSRMTVYNWKDDDPAFEAAILQAQEGAWDALERSMYQRACAGDTIAAIFMLKGRRPKVWHDKARLEVSGPGGGPIPVQVAPEEAQELRETARQLREAKGSTDASE